MIYGSHTVILCPNTGAPGGREKRIVVVPWTRIDEATPWGKTRSFRARNEKTRFTGKKNYDAFMRRVYYMRMYILYCVICVLYVIIIYSGTPLYSARAQRRGSGGGCRRYSCPTAKSETRRFLTAILRRNTTKNFTPVPPPVRLIRGYCFTVYTGSETARSSENLLI